MKQLKLFMFASSASLPFINASIQIHSKQGIEPLTSFKPKPISYFKTEVILIGHKFCGDTYIDPISY